MSNTARAEANAVEFGNHVGAPGWYNGFLVACSVEKGAGQGKRLNRTDEKIGIVAFGKKAHQHQTVVKAYLDAWDSAAADELVPTADELTPTDAEAGLEFAPEVHTTEAWADYFNALMANKRAVDRTYEQERRKPTKKQIELAIETDPELEKVARETVIRKEDQRMAAAARKKITDKKPVDDGTLSQREIDEADAQFDSLIVKLRAMRRTGQEALTLALDIHGFDQNAKRALVSESVDGLRTLLDAIAEAADGRSMDDELQSLLSEGN